MFIELTDNAGTKVLINTSHIMYCYQPETKKAIPGTIIRFLNGSEIPFIILYDELKLLLTGKEATNSTKSRFERLPHEDTDSSQA
jgi:hypothetical protein